MAVAIAVHQQGVVGSYPPFEVGGWHILPFRIATNEMVTSALVSELRGHWAKLHFPFHHVFSCRIASVAVATIWVLREMVKAVLGRARFGIEARTAGTYF